MTWQLGNFVPWQRKVLKGLTKKQFVVVAAGRRSGKTYLIQQLIHITALSGKRDIAVVYPSLKQAKSVLFHTLCEDYHNHREYFAKKGLYKPTMEFTYYNGSRVKFFSLERPDDIRGNEYDLVVLDEAQEMTDADDVIQNIITPVLTPTVARIAAGHKAGKCLICGTSKGRNDFYDLVTRGNDPNFPSWETYIIETTPKNCPHIPEAYLQQIKLDMDPKAFEREYLCSFESYEGIIYSNFDRAIHVKSSIPNIAIKKAIVAIDYGWAHNCGIVVVVQFKDDTYWVVDEVKAPQLSMDKISNIVNGFIDKWHATSVYCSPEEANLINELKKTIRKAIVKKANNDHEGISYIRTLMHQDTSNPLQQRLSKFYVTANCVETIKEIEAYVYKDGTENPLKVNDDLVDSIRYAIFSNSKDISTRAAPAGTFTYY